MITSTHHYIALRIAFGIEAPSSGVKLTYIWRGKEVCVAEKSEND